MTKETKSAFVQFKAEPTLKKTFVAACEKRGFKESEIMRFLIIHFAKNPDMKFDI